MAVTIFCDHAIGKCSPKPIWGDWKRYSETISYIYFTQKAATYNRI